MNPLISVIVPVCNVEKYINNCVNSIIAQTYKNLEIILVNDGSTDNSGALCDKWVLQDSRIKVFHKKNGGPSETRNLGVANASGNYVAFIDSDDYVSEKYVEILYNNLVCSGADIACCNYKTVSESSDYSVFQPECCSSKTITGQEACFEMFKREKEVYFCVLWGKLFKKSILELHPLPVGKVHEDEATTFKYLYDAKKISISEQILYAYYQNPKSIMHVRSANRRPDALWAKMQRVYFFEEKKETALFSKSLGQVVDFYISRAIMDQTKLPQDAGSFAKKYWKSIEKKDRFNFALYTFSPQLHMLCHHKNKMEYLKSLFFIFIRKIFPKK